MKPYQIDATKWQRFTPDIQLRNIAAELARATNAELHHQSTAWITEAMERALAMIDASIEDSQWSEKKFLHQLRDAIASLYAHPADPAISRFITNELLAKSMKNV